ncbi:hypothetical protein OHT59_22105 [Streptomyces sp. NBC_00243]|uniref:hypothetical protein n=1 Tax=Streptomyces sp. NBC_00243 TaxID=2975688 RepID=UPI002DD95C70|nr:hypothetical protein [Streptomyces sp. NBC_00243]WRZ21008.1 hypothetical protein OHT59_22105 [Streptomyces sp. NBC_00243]
MEAERLQALRRADDLIENSGRVFDSIVEIGKVNATAWASEPGTLLRRSTRLALAKALASAELLGDEQLKIKVEQYLGRATEILETQSPATMSEKFSKFAESYQQLLNGVNVWQVDLTANADSMRKLSS